MMLIVLIFGISASFAADAEDSIQATDDEVEDAVSAGEVETVSASDTQEKTTSQENETIMSASDTPEDTLGATGTFTQLQTLINNNYGKTLTLTQDYAYDTAFGKTTGVEITSAITIDGQGKYTIDGKSASRIFQISGANVVIKNLNFVNGKTTQGGAIYWSGTNGQVINSNFTTNTATHNGNAGGAIYISGSGTKVTNSNFFRNVALTRNGDGGAIFIGTSDIIIDNCWFEANTAIGDTGADSGAVSIWGTRNTIQNSNFTNNKGGWNGAVLIFTTGDNNKILNSIFVNNTSLTYGGAVRVQQGNNEISGCIFINNKATSDGGAIRLDNYDSTTIVYQNNIINNCEFINNNAGGNGGAIANTAGQNTLSITNSKFEGNTANNGDAVYNNGNGAVIDECTFFVAEGKTVNDYVSSSTSITITDTKYGKLYVSPTGTGTGLTANSPTNWANAYNLIGDDGEIIFLAGTYNIVNFNIDKSIKLTGQGNVIIDAQKNGRIFTVSASDVTIDHVTLKNGKLAATGGAVYWTGADGTLINSNIISNVVTNGRGGAIYWSGRNGLLSNNYFYDNNASVTSGDHVGGAIYINGANSKITHSTFENNHVYGGSADGGGVATEGNYIEVNSCLFLDNTAQNDSGGCTIWGQYNKVINCTFRNNRGTHNGALLFYNNHNSASNCTFINNSCNGPGGAFRCDFTNCSLSDSIFINNTATTNGGAVFWTGTQGTISGCEFTNNSANYGGAISVGKYSTFADNLNINNCEFENNHARTNGGAIYNDANNVVVSDSTFNGNTAPTNNDVSSTKGITVTELTFNADLTMNVNDIIVGESLTITGTLSAAKAGAVIAIKDNGINMGSVTVNNGKFTYNYATPSAGVHAISLATTDDSGNNYVYNTNSFSFRAVPNDSYSALQMLINRATASSTLTLARTYNYNSNYDSALIGGVKVNKTLIINGAGYSIDGKNAARAFEVSANGVTIENAKLINGKSTSNGGAVYWTGSTGILKDITFINNNANSYRHVYTTKTDLKISGSKFPDTTVTLTANPTSTMYGNNIQLTVNFNDGTNVAKTLNVLSGSSTVTGVTVPASGTVTTTWTKPAAGNYTLTLATTDSNANTYTFTQPNIKVEVKKYTTDFTVTVTGSKVQEDVTITINTGKSDATGTVDVLFNGQNTRLTLSGGKASMNVGKLAANPYDVSATYSGDAKYQGTTKGTSFTITKYATTTTLTLTNVNVGNAVPVVATVTSSAPFAVNGKIILVGAQGNKTITINNGQGNLDVSDLPAGRYVVTL